MKKQDVVIAYLDFQLHCPFGRFEVVNNLLFTWLAPNNLEEKSLDELDELEDEEDERVLEAYRQKRIAELRELANKSKYGEVREISAEDYVQEVNKAGEDIWVVLHLYKSGYNYKTVNFHNTALYFENWFDNLFIFSIPLCTLINLHLTNLARKFPTTKFLKSISTTCISNWPDSNLPTIFIYHNGNMVKQIIGPLELRGMKLTERGNTFGFRVSFASYKIKKYIVPFHCAELEWMLGQVEAVPTNIKEDPRPKVRDVLFSSLKNENEDLDDDNDW